jgi:hypothetical protein
MATRVAREVAGDAARRHAAERTGWQASSHCAHADRERGGRGRTPRGGSRRARRSSQRGCRARARAGPADASRQTTPATAKRGTSRPTRDSSVERNCAVRGAWAVASRAGASAPASVPSTPSSAPRNNTCGSSSSDETCTAKYRSLIVRVTSRTRPEPSQTPSARPRIVPTVPSTSASPHTKRKTCARVTRACAIRPTARAAARPRT